MRVHPQMLHNVVFFAVDEREGNTTRSVTRGTGWFVRLPGRHSYLVTCRHVAIRLNAAVSNGAGWGILVNGLSGKYDRIPHTEALAIGGRWYFHPTDPDAVDLAVLPLALNGSHCKSLDIDLFMERSELLVDVNSDDPNDGWGRPFHVGNEVFWISLFRQLPIANRVHPILRRGSLALAPWPGESIPTEDMLFPGKAGKDMELFLVEARSIGGMSGAPVFIMGDEIPKAPVSLLGVMRGHWSLAPEQRNKEGALLFQEADAAYDDANDNKVNVGIAGVVPIWKLAELLNQPTLVQLRAERDASARAGEARETLD
jgi:hypothetical protein